MPGAIIIALIPLLPLFTFLVLGLYGRKFFKNASGIIGTLSLLISFVIAVFTAYSYFHIHQGSHPAEIPFKYTWLQFNEGMSIDMGIQLDPISVMMIVVVTFVSLMVHIFSLGYMKGEERYPT
jgi:NADH-quinone oxidoreductase subunit L